RRGIAYPRWIVPVRAWTSPIAKPSRKYLYPLCFFFQAEDGIRDLIVTGVQTCALPIFLDRGWRCGSQWRANIPDLRWQPLHEGRSEERRVGKECRARGSRYD